MYLLHICCIKIKKNVSKTCSILEMSPWCDFKSYNWRCLAMSWLVLLAARFLQQTISSLNHPIWMKVCPFSTSCHPFQLSLQAIPPISNAALSSGEESPFLDQTQLMQNKYFLFIVCCPISPFSNILPPSATLHRVGLFTQQLFFSFSAFLFCPSVPVARDSSAKRYAEEHQFDQVYTKEMICKRL